MLFAQFSIDSDKYVVSINEVVEIIPFVRVKPIPKTPKYVTGIINYRGKTVPVIDLCHMMIGRGCSKKLSTRIIVASLPDEGNKKMVGLLVEKATETFREEISSFIDPVIYNAEADYIGPVLANRNELITLISVKELISKVDAGLFYPEKVSV